ncbi:MAG: long-chain fatty acid--CoA ligase, partial [Candidatus Electrothrix sp. ATG2]|nr:long-chain fatty acid--CoA ligase [Candidatus Electrothrix sp. ATG2]
MRIPLFPPLFRCFESLPEVFEARVRFFPEREAIVSDQVRLSFRQLEEKVSRFAVYLLDNNVRQGDWAAIMLPNCSEFVISFLALAKIGAVIVPVDTSFGTQELNNLFDTIPLTTCITNPAFLPTVQPVLIEKPGCANLILDQVCHEGTLDTAALSNTTSGTSITWPKLRPRTPFLYLYTSGTTGPPKGILLDHDRVMRISIGWRNRLPLRGDEKCYNLAPLFRSPALFSVIGAGIYYGITMTIPSEFRPKKVWDEIASERA